MTTAALEKRVRALEAQMKALKGALRKATPVRASVVKPMKAKKLSPGLQQALREVTEGKLSGPFNTVEELMEHLR